MNKGKTMNDIEVIISGKRYTMRGYESEEYLQKVASYINNKYEQLKKSESFRFFDADTRNMLLNINISDDYFKVAARLEEIVEEKLKNDQELFEVKHEMILANTKLDAVTEELEIYKLELSSAQSTILRLQEEIKKKK